ncbi:MAG: hypothetical protein ACOY93_07100 [Bacillota bacterium]
MRRWLALILLMLTIAGCAAPTTAPDPAPQPGAGAEEPVREPAGGEPGPEPVVEGPRLRERWYYRESPGLPGPVDGITRIQLDFGREEAIVGSGEVVFTWVLERPLPDAQERVGTAGHSPMWINVVENVVQARFAAGGPERWEVWLEGVEGSRTVLVRAPEPTVRIGYRLDGGELVMVEGGELSLPSGKLTLEFTFDQPLSPTSVDLWREAVLMANPLGGSFSFEPQKLDWIRWELPRVPSKLELSFGRLQAAATGLPVTGPGNFLVQSLDSAPYLEKVNLATGERQRLVDLPPEISEVHLSPDGRWLALRSFVKQVDGWRNTRAHVVDLQARKLLPVPIHATELHWSGTRLLNFAYRWGEKRGWESWDPQAGGEPAFHPGELYNVRISPDGRYAAQLGYREGAEMLLLLVTDLETGARREFPDFIRGWTWQKGGDWSQWTAWSPDGRRVAALDPVERTGRSDLVAVDVTTGERQVLREGLNLSVWAQRLAWSPDGKSVLVQRAGRVIPLDGGPEQKVPGAFYWDGKSQRLLGADRDWAGVFVHDLRDGSRQELGDGLPVGWEGDWVYIIRWGASDRRYIEPMP